MSSHTSVSVVIRAYNEEEHIEKLLLGIKAQRLQPHEIILVDSGSTDDTVSIAERYGVKLVTISKHDFTFGRALNLGCEAASGDVLVVASAHVYPTHDVWLERLVAPFSNPKVVLSYGKQRGGDTNKFSEHQLFAKWFPNQAANPQRTYFCNNANCAIRRSVWTDLSYDEELTGLEDLDWAKKAQARGGWLVYVPDAKVIHIHDETWQQIRTRYFREALALRQIDDHAHFRVFDFIRLLIGHVVSDAQAAARAGSLLKELPSIARFRFNQLIGTWKGHNGPSEVSGQLRQRFYFPTSKEDHHGDEVPHDDHLIDYEGLATKAGEDANTLTVVSDNTSPTRPAARQQR